jgi:hypothetical protein
MTTSFEYGVSTIGGLRVETRKAEDAKDLKSGRSRQAVVTDVLIDDEPLTPTERFWNSLYIRYGFSKSIFSYFTHEEVFARIAEVSPQERIRYCIERDEETGAGRLLGVSNPKRAVVGHDDLMELLEQYRAEGLTYHNGVVESRHTPRIGGNLFSISGDQFAHRFVLRTPVDGFGQPNIYLSLLRQICSNGMIGHAKAFRSEITLGRGSDSPTYSLLRALDGFNNDEGYAALRQRFESAATSWASVHEAVGLYNLLAKLVGSKQVRHELVGHDGAASGDAGVPLLKAFHRMTGDVSRIYGLANLDALSVKRQRTLPVSCKVYDLLNFATEIATHHARTEGSRRLQAWVGTLISNEYDMEGTTDNYSDFRDFFVDEAQGRDTLDDLSLRN